MKHLFTVFCILLFIVAILGDDSKQRSDSSNCDQRVDSTGDYDSAYDDSYDGSYDDAYDGSYDDAYDGNYDDSQGGNSNDTYDGSYDDSQGGNSSDTYGGKYDDSQGGDDTYEDGEDDRRKRDIQPSEEFEVYRYK